jgi:histone-lysine N-methyltransferase SETMAR
MNPSFIDGRTQEYTAVSAAIIVVAVRAGRGLFLNSIVTTDETWVNYFKPGSKHSLMQWRYPGSPETKKAKTTFSVKKVMTTIFWDSKGVLYVDFLTELRTINSEYYSALLECPVKTAISNKIKREQTSMSFVQDNTRPHVATRTMDTIQKPKWNVLPHHPYSPDLAPTGYHLFGPLKEHLDRKSFRNTKEVIQDVQEWL